ncbi:Fc.00g099520.m01.CDS01 [Cosmosporella sp. VM-42]
MPSRVPRPLPGLRRSKSTSTVAVVPTAVPAAPEDVLTSTKAALWAGKVLIEEASELLREQQLGDIEDGPKRNRLFKEAFRVEARELDDPGAQKIHKAFIARPQSYPNEKATRASYKEHLRDTRRQVGLGIVWSHFNMAVPQWTDCFHLIKTMTPQWSDRTSMSAVRIVLPKSWDIDVNNQNMEYVDSVTGVLRKLRTVVDKNPSAIVLRGKSSVLTAAADEIVRFCKEAEVYELGEVGTSDYKTKQLWPTIEGAPNAGASLPEDKMDNIWVHKEYQPHWLTKPYEDIPKPEIWTQENFETYVATLTYGRIPSHLAIPFYGKRAQNGRHIDTEGIRIRLIVEAFEDPAARPFITASVLKMAISLMAFKGGHRASASRLIALGEEWGIPMDTDIFNVMLEGYAHKRDVGFFFRFLRRMEARYYQPNIRTWLLFLQLIKGDDERRQAIVAMYELGMFNHNATRKGIAEVMASQDAYSAFKAGTPLDAFLLDQKERYGSDWCTVEAMNKIITELLRFHRKEDPRIADCKKLIQIRSEAGQRIELSTINLLLSHAANTLHWDIALWAMSLFKPSGCEPDQNTYAALMSLCIKSQSPHALGTVYFYGVLARKLKTASRSMLRKVLLRKHPDPFWKYYQPGIFPKEAVYDLWENKIPSSSAIMSRIERVILEKWDGYIPTKPLARSLEAAFRTNDQPFHQQISSGRQRGEVKVLVLKLKRTNGEEGNINVRLAGTFEPQQMILGWDWRETPKEQSARMTPEVSYDDAPETSTADADTTPKTLEEFFQDVSSNSSPQRNPDEPASSHWRSP